jgi:hypothetical protein
VAGAERGKRRDPLVRGSGGRFGANAAWQRLAVITHNVLILLTFIKLNS